jgi:glycosyltransferase involved in cell wall biosynthesis
MSGPTFTICLPAYNAALVIGDTIRSVLAQTWQDFEVVVVDDCSTDDTERAVRSFGDDRIRYYRNSANLGLPGNLTKCAELARGEYLYLLGNDDILSPVALDRTKAAFELDPEVALVTRPYYWFLVDDIDRPVRAVLPFSAISNKPLSVFDGERTLSKVLETLGQISGLAYRRSMFSAPFSRAVFTTHIEPALRTWRDHKAVLLDEYIVAVRIATSQTRYLSSIYEPSPTQTWIDMFDRVFASENFARQRRWGHEHIAKHVEGLVQIRCYAPFKLYWKEMAILVKSRKRNLISPRFWAYAFFLSLAPRRAIVSVVDKIKPLVTGLPDASTIHLARNQPIKERSIPFSRAASDS